MPVKFIWFSRHEPTVEQLEEIKKLMAPSPLSDLWRLPKLAAAEMVTSVDVIQTWISLQSVIGNDVHVFLFGVFPAPLMELFHQKAEVSKNVPLYRYDITLVSAWNTMRSVEGQKPTFQHKRFCTIGRYLIQ